MIIDTILLGLMGMGGVFLGLALLTLSLILLPMALARLGLEAVEAPATGARETMGPKPEIDSPPKVAEGGEAFPEESGSSPVHPWRLAGGPFGSPTLARWIRPAFRAAFRSASPSSPLEKEIIVGGKAFHVEFLSLEGSVARVRVNGRELTVDLGDFSEEIAAPLPPVFPAVPRPAPVPAKRKAPKVSAPKPKPVRSTPSPAAPAAETEAIPGGVTPIRAPIPGTIKKILVGVGDGVQKGRLIFIVEAMKMDNEIFSPMAGKVKEIRVQEMSSVRQGELLALIEP